MKNEGWTYLTNSPKWHYFRDGRSLCGKWGTFAKEFDDTENIESSENCSSCAKRRKKELLNPATAGEGTDEHT